MVRAFLAFFVFTRKFHPWVSTYWPKSNWVLFLYKGIQISLPKMRRKYLIQLRIQSGSRNIFAQNAYCSDKLNVYIVNRTHV